VHEKEAKRIQPSESYELSLPRCVQEEHDGRVSSFWLAGAPLLLQLSSYVRRDGPQVMARDRLKDRVAKTSGNWILWKQSVNANPQVDQATAELLDTDGVLWVHSYLVWSHLAIYATISGPADVVRDPENWAMKGLRSIQPIVQ
jgi:hypothetical protein